MPMKPSPSVERILKLDVDRTCVTPGKPHELFRTIRKHHPERKFTASAIDGVYLVRRLA